MPGPAPVNASSWLNAAAPAMIQKIITVTCIVASIARDEARPGELR